MTYVIESRLRSKYDRTSLKRRLTGLANRLESLSRLQLCSPNSPWRLSADFGLRFLPSQTQQKSHGHLTNPSRCHFSLLPPAGNLFFVGAFRQSAQTPHKPKGASHYFNPNLNTPFGRQTVELAGSQAQIAFHKPDAMFDVAVATHKKIELVFQTQVFKLKRDMQKRSRDLASSSALRQNPVAEGNDETPAHSSTTVRGRSSPARTSAAGNQNHPRTPGGKKCK